MMKEKIEKVVKENPEIAKAVLWGFAVTLLVGYYAGHKAGMAKGVVRGTKETVYYLIELANK